MKSKIIIAVIVVVILVVVYLFIKRQARNKADKLELNGLTRSEFLSTIRKDWKAEFWRVFTTDYLVYKGQIIVQTFSDGQKNYAVDQSWSADIYNESQETGEPIADIIERATQFAWDKDSSTPMNVEWGYKHWLPKNVDNLGIDYNNTLVRELIKQI